ncbi:MAG: GAF domain-containing protein [Streptomyces turgidiscabies]|nr:GAF domain-containing protein [Streptomyces turgidiscabies]
MRGDLGEFAVRALRDTAQYAEGVVHVAAQDVHDDAACLVDDGPGAQGRVELFQLGQRGAVGAVADQRGGREVAEGPYGTVLGVVQAAGAKTVEAEGDGEPGAPEGQRDAGAHPRVERHGTVVGPAFRDTVVRRLNSAATVFTGARPGYTTGRPLAGLLGPADRAAFRSQVAAVARGDGDRSLTVRFQQRPSLPVHTTLTALRPNGEPRPTVLVVLQPTDLRLPPNPPEQGRNPASALPDLSEATRHAALLDLLDAMTSALLTTPSRDGGTVVERAAGVLHDRFADWVIADTGSGRPVRTTVLGPSGADTDAVAAQDPADCPLVVEAARGGSPAPRVRLDQDPDAFGRDATGAPVLVQANVTSLLCVPLARDGVVLGVLTLFRSGARPAFSMAEAQAMDMMSRHIALAVDQLPSRRLS